jgi:hypothetical protein
MQKHWGVHPSVRYIARRPQGLVYLHGPRVCHYRHASRIQHPHHHRAATPPKSRNNRRHPAPPSVHSIPVLMRMPPIQDHAAHLASTPRAAADGSAFISPRYHPAATQSSRHSSVPCGTLTVMLPSLCGTSHRQAMHPMRRPAPSARSAVVPGMPYRLDG